MLVGEGNETLKCVEISSYQMRFKTARESPKRTISSNGRFELLQMVSKPNTGWCARNEHLERGTKCSVDAF